MDMLCDVCNYDMKIYYKNMNYQIYYCCNCCNFKCKIYDNKLHNTESIFSVYDKYKLKINSYIFYSMFYNQNSYFISDSLNVQWELEKIINYINKKRTNVNTVYINCYSYDNIDKIENKGVYNIYSTNSAKYVASKFNLTLMNVFVITDFNRTIYEYQLYSYFEPKYITDLLYKEIEHGLYVS